MRLFIILLLILLPRISGAACSWVGSTGTSASCSYTDVADCLDDAGATAGSTIVLPACDTTAWTSGITISVGLTLQGGGPGVTKIRTNNTVNPLFTVGANNTVITGLTIYGPDTATGNQTTRAIQINGSTGVRIHNIYFLRDEARGGNAVAPIQGATGVIDNCYFDYTTEQISIRGSGATRTEWAEDTALGSSAQLYVENNTFVDSLGLIGHAVLGDEGCKMVVRHNDISGQDVDAHGYCSTASGVRQLEIYSNKFTETTYEYGLNLRGSTGVVFKNVFLPTHYFIPAIRLTEYRVTESGCYDNCCTEYPCLDQIGRGKNQALEPMYFWGDLYDSNKDGTAEDTYGVDYFFAVVNQNATSECTPDVHTNTFIVENQDYYKSATTAKSGYTPYTCPHPLVGSGACNENVPGKNGYSLVSAGGSGSISGGGSASTLGGGSGSMTGN